MRVMLLSVLFLVAWVMATATMSAANRTSGKIVEIKDGQLTLHVLRGHSGIMRR